MDLEKIQNIRRQILKVLYNDRADLIVSPIGRALIGKKTKEDFKIIKKKFRRNSSGHVLGHGLIVFPIQKTGPATQSPFI